MGRSSVAALIGSIFIQIGTNLANDYSDAKRGADTAERLGPVRVTSSGLVAPRRVLVATWVAFGVAVARGPLPDRGGRSRDPRRRRRLDPGGRPLHGRAEAVRLRRPRRGLRVPLLRAGGGERLLLRAARGSRAGCRSCSRSRSGCSRRRSSSSTTSGTSIRTGARARSRSRCASAASGHALLYAYLLASAFAAGPGRGPRRRTPRPGRCSPSVRRPSPDRPLRAVLTRTRRRGPERRAGGHRRPARALQPAAHRRSADRRGMKIAEVETVPYALPFREDYVTARGALAAREIVLLRLRTDDGVEGLGEAVPMTLRGGESLERVERALRRSVRRIRRLDPSRLAGDESAGGGDRCVHPCRRGTAAGGPRGGRAGDGDLRPRRQALRISPSGGSCVARAARPCAATPPCRPGTRRASPRPRAAGCRTASTRSS